MDTIESLTEVTTIQSLDTRELVDTVVLGTFNAKGDVLKLLLGESVRLHREPDHPKHKNTIRVENKDGTFLGYIMRELADFTAPFMDLSKCDMPGKVIELATDALGESIRLQICFYLPSYWFRTNLYPEHLYIQDIYYYYWEDHVTGNIKVFINSSERMFRRVQNEFSANNLKFDKFSGLSHRYPLGKPPYQWCIYFDKTTGINESKIKTFFKEKFNIVPIDDRIKRVNKEKHQLESEMLSLQRELTNSKNLVEQLDAEVGTQKEQLESHILQLQEALYDKEEAIAFKEKEYKALQFRFDNQQYWGNITPTNRDDVVAIEIETLLNIFKKGISDKLTPKESLTVISMVFPGRVFVLPSALESAERSERFKQSKKLFEKLLWILATDHWNLLVRGKGDVEIKDKYPTDCYSAKEAETVENNPRLRKLRTFYYNGQAIEMMSHLKTGVKDNVERTIRIHFKWFAKERKIIIGYCGPHLPLK